MAKVRITNEKNKRIFSFLLLDCRVLNKNKKILLVFFSRTMKKIEESKKSPMKSVDAANYMKRNFEMAKNM